MGQQTIALRFTQYPEITSTTFLLLISSFPVELVPYSVDILRQVGPSLNKIGAPPLKGTLKSPIILDHLAKI